MSREAAGWTEGLTRVSEASRGLNNHLGLKIRPSETDAGIDGVGEVCGKYYEDIIRGGHRPPHLICICYIYPFPALKLAMALILPCRALMVQPEMAHPFWLNNRGRRDLRMQPKCLLKDRLYRKMEVL